jgi:uncharacterized protein YqcC (DUF446 family)
MTIYVEAASLLIDIEAQLRRLGQWQRQPPSAEALASTEPFCIDTLSFAQWLQFVFLPRMYELLAREQLPPGPCGIGPLAEEYFKGSKLDAVELLQYIAALDQLLSTNRT